MLAIGVVLVAIGLVATAVPVQAEDPFPLDKSGGSVLALAVYRHPEARIRALARGVFAASALRLVLWLASYPV